MHEIGRTRGMDVMCCCPPAASASGQSPGESAPLVDGERAGAHGDVRHTQSLSQIIEQMGSGRSVRLRVGRELGKMGLAMRDPREKYLRK